MRNTERLEIFWGKPNKRNRRAKKDQRTVKLCGQKSWMGQSYSSKKPGGDLDRITDKIKMGDIFNSY